MDFFITFEYGNKIANATAIQTDQTDDWKNDDSLLWKYTYFEYMNTYMHAIAKWLTWQKANKKHPQILHVLHQFNFDRAFAIENQFYHF